MNARIIIARVLILYSTIYIKNPLFLKTKKPFSKMPKGWKLTSSPYWKALELLRGILQ